MRINRSTQRDSSFVADGYERALDGIEQEVRYHVEQEYAETWNSAGLLQRWRIHKEMEREIAKRVAKQSAHISPSSLF